jgi:exopolysaccharide biosynthesis polyprenyl glycosylphosphotransferase
MSSLGAAAKDSYLDPRYEPPAAPYPRRSGEQRLARAHLASAPTAGVRPYHRRLFVELCRPADALVALLVFAAVFLIENADAMPNGPDDFLLLRLTLLNLVTLGAFGYAWSLVFLLFGLYDTSESRTLRAEAPSVAGACTVGAMLALLPVLWSRSGAYGIGVVGAAWPLTIAATLALRAVLRVVAERAHDAKVQRVVIVGSGPRALELYERVLSDSTLLHQVLGFVDTENEITVPLARANMLGSLEELESILMRTVVDEVLITLPVKSRYAEIQRAIEDCERAGVQSRYSPELFPARLAKAHVETPQGHPVVAMKVVSDDYRLVAKRALDIVASAAMLLLLSPLFGVIAVAIACTTPGPVLFGQERFGWRKRLFTMWKFRTMVHGAETLQDQLESRNEAKGPVFKIRDDPRVTRLGRFLRRTSMDELPQFWNVLRGDMSLVGPRPLPTRDVHRFAEAALMRRFSVMPGITCLWQIDGRSDLAFERWIELDLQYIDRWSLALDLSIMLRTLPAVFRGRGAV